MKQKAPESKVDVFRTILDLESRGQQIEEIVQRIKEAFLIPRGGVSLPEAVGVLDELHWSTNHLSEGVRALEAHLGIRRQPVKPNGTAAPPKPNHALRGSTRSIPMPDLIALLSAQRKTGTLYIKCADERFVLELLEGAIVHVVSDSPRNKQRLGDILVAQEKISTDALEEFLSHYCRKDGRLGEALARTKVVSEEDLRDALEYQVRELFRRVFAVDEALFSFQSGKVSDLQHRVSLNTTQLLLETARLEDEQRREAVEQGRSGSPFDAFEDHPDASLDDAPLGEHAQCGETAETVPPDSCIESTDAEPTGTTTAEPSGEADPSAVDDGACGETWATDEASDPEARAPEADHTPTTESAEDGASTDASPSDVARADAAENAADAVDQDADATAEAPADADADADATNDDEAPTTDAETQTSAHGTSEKEAIRELQQVSGITKRTAKQLYRQGVQDIEGVRRASDRDLLAVPGIGHRTLRLIRQYCGTQRTED